MCRSPLFSSTRFGKECYSFQMYSCGTLFHPFLNHIFDSNIFKLTTFFVAITNLLQQFAISSRSGKQTSRDSKLRYSFTTSRKEIEILGKRAIGSKSKSDFTAHAVFDALCFNYDGAPDTNRGIATQRKPNFQ